MELPHAIVRVRVATSPRRPTIVFTPDPPNVIEHYDTLFRVLEGDAGMVCFEMPGFGHSVPRRGYGFSFAENAQVVVELLESLALAPCVLAFPCVAGLIGVVVARERPDLVSHVVTLQTASLPEMRRWAQRVDPRGIVRTPVLGQLALAVGRRRIARSWYGAAIGPRHDSAAHTDVALRAFDAGASFSLASGLQALGRASGSVVGRAPQPSLSIWGAADRTHRRTDRTSVLSHLPVGSRAVDLADAGHFPEIETPARFRDELLAFLRSSG